MNPLQSKPWSAFDDGDDSAGTAAVVPANAPEVADGADVRAARQAAAACARAWSVTPQWAFVPMVGALLWTAALAARGTPEASRTSWLGPCACVLVAGGTLAAGVASQRRRTRAVLASLRQAAQPSGRAASRVKDTQWPRALQALLDEVYDELGRMSDALAASRDKGVELGYRLATNEQRFARAAVGAISDAVILLDGQERVALLNPAAEALLGVMLKDAVRRPLADFVSDEPLLQWIRQVQRLPFRSKRTIDHAMGGRTYSTSACVWTTSPESEDGADGSFPASLEDDDARVVVIVLHDVTREKETLKAASEVVAHVAHELRTPLSSLKAYVEMLVDGEANDEQTRREYFDIIQAETERTSRLIDDVLNVTRIESGLVKVQREPVALAMVVREVADVMRPQAEMKNIRLVDELVPVMHEVLADRDLIYQAVMNLVSNAVKYTQEGGTIRIRMRVDESERALVTEVSDTGVGIPQADLPRVFEKFFRVKANNKIAKGTGLGLNLVRNVVELVHGGKVAVTSQVGEGTTFSIRLPLL